MKQVHTNFENACRTFLLNVLMLNKGDSLLIYIDRAPEKVVSGDNQVFAKSIGIDTEVLQLQRYSNLAEMVDALCGKISGNNFNTVCELSDRYFYLTRVWRQAIQKGCRLFSIDSIDAPSFIRCMGEANQEKLAEFGSTCRD